jgi:2-methylcitrate dehydratase PrpD
MSVTAQLVSNILASHLEAIPQDVHHEAKRAVLNIVGCALGGANHPSMDITMQALGPYSVPPTSMVLGLIELFVPLLVSILNGISSNIHVYVDTLQ